MNRTFLLSLTVLLACVPLAEAQMVPVTTTSDAARVQFERGRARLSHANFAQARVHFDAALAADPSFGLAHLYRAVAGADGREDHARQAGSARVSDGERQLIDAYAAHLGGDHDAELALLDAVAERFPNDPNVPFWMGAEYYTLERYDEAADAFERASAADPAFAGAYNLLGYTAMEQGDDAAAERAFREYIRLAPDEANPYDSFGEFHMLRGRYDEAEALFEQALTRDPGFTVSRDNLVRIAVTRITDAWEAGARAGDGAAIAALYADDAVIHPANEPPAQGREALDAYFAASYGEPVDVTFTTVEIVVSGDLAYEVGASASPAGAGKYLTLYRRVGDEWKIVADTWSDDAPPAATAAAGSN
jgi:Tfp pilus assembly protein PilF/ketosteroid isomerase-like protein